MSPVDDSKKSYWCTETVRVYSAVESADVIRHDPGDSTKCARWKSTVSGPNLSQEDLGPDKYRFAGYLRERSSHFNHLLNFIKFD